MSIIDWLNKLRPAPQSTVAPATPVPVRQSVPGFVPWEQGGGAGFKPGDRVRVAREHAGRVENAGCGVVLDAYDRASDAFSPYSAGIRVHLDGGDPRGIEYFIGYDTVERE